MAKSEEYFVYIPVWSSHQWWKFLSKYAVIDVDLFVYGKVGYFFGQALCVCVQ